MNEVIRQRRSELGMSQGDLATKVGVDRRQIRRYESGET
ncbi:MAG: helix-turn-helix transcriptional regulator [Pseudonocardia sp.]